MKETHITIYIHDLEISDKSKSFLGRVGLMRLNDLLNCDMMELSATRNISEDVLQELNGVIAHADDIICFFEERAKRIKEILPDVQDTPIESLRLGTRATNALRRGGIHTVGALIQMSQKDIFELRNVGVLSREEITKAIESIIQSGKVVHHERAEEPEAVIETTPESSRLSELLPEIESISLDDVPFSVRARNALKRANVQTAGELVQMSKKDIMSLRNVGAQTRDEILAIIDVIIRDGRGYFDNLTSQDNQELGDEPMGINDFSWTEKLVGKDGVLKVAVDEFRGTVQYYIDEYRRLLAEGLTQQAAAVEKKLWSYRRGKEDNRGRNELIEFLVRNNVLPKYGFPVDTVELYQNTNAATDKKLQMVRDLQLAISEYAPDSQVVADGKLYTSRYIRKLPQTTGQDWETAYIAQCNNPSCMTWNHRLMEPNEGGEPCVSCHEIISKSRWKQAIEPRKGFVADAKPKDVPMRKPDKAFRSDDFYIGDAQRQVMQKYAFVMKDGNRFQMETSINDSLMVVCNDDFYVCPHCGYAESTMENMEVAGFNSHQKTLEKKHITPWGKNCEVKLVKNKLCHVFKTDVVRLVFSTPQAGNQEVMLSVMYALLEALSSVMDIERNDIKGCLHKIVYDNKLIYAIVLYDAVAGGAGHVRRLVTEDGRCFRQVVEKAIAITKGCNCSPSCYSCLRNYYNQKIHDLLNRKYAYDFLENYNGELEPITNEEFENGELYNV